jgi:hypothetical protein
MLVGTTQPKAVFMHAGAAVWQGEPSFSEKQRNNQRKNCTDYQHRRYRKVEHTILAFYTNITGQFSKPAEQHGRITEANPYDQQQDAGNDKRSAHGFILA